MKILTKKDVSTFAVCLLLFITGKVSAQQDPMYSMYMFNGMGLNPAYAGSYDDIAATLLYRKQWMGFSGAPQTAGFNIHTPFKGEKMGLGMSFVNDRYGSISQNYLNAAYAYHLSFKKSRLSFGLQAVMQNFSAALNKLQTNQQGTADNAFQQNISVFGANFGTGAFWYAHDFYAGVSVPHLLPGNMEKKLTGDPEQARQRMHAYLMGGYVFKLNTIMKIKPSVLVKYADNSPSQLDVNAMVYLYDKLGLGAGYRTGGTADFMTEIILKKGLRVAYAFDYTLSDLAQFNSGSHEIIVQYHFGFEKNRISSPRFF